MDNSAFNRTETESSTNNNISNSIQTLFLSVGPRQRILTTNSNADFTMEMKESNESTSSVPPNRYGYLEHIQTYKPLCRFNDKSLPRKVRKFYEKQLELITSIEAILLPKTEQEKKERMANQHRQRQAIRILITTTLIINIILVIIKIIGAIVSRSLSVISSVVNSVLDIRTNLMLIWAARSIKKRDPYKYPAGRTGLQPVSIIMLSIIMCTASVQIIIESGKRLSQDIQYFQNQHNASSTKTLHDIDMTVFPIIAMVLSIVSKGVLFILSYRNKHPNITVLNEDNRNDVVSGIVALACGLIASNALHGKIKKEAIVIDPIGAIVISACIVFAWGLHAYRHVRYLTGLTADTFVLQRITHIAYNHRPDVVTNIDSIQAVHFGMNYFVDVDIGLSRTMPLSMAHDIGIELQEQLETIDDIERAFVHLDFEFTHMPAVEHKKLIMEWLNLVSGKDLIHSLFKFI